MTVRSAQPEAVRSHLPAGTFPINLDLEGRHCLVVGGGPVGARKAAGLAAAGAAVTVVAANVGEEMHDLVARNRNAVSPSVIPIVVHERPYHRGEAASYRLVVTATDDPAVNRQVFHDSEAAGVWCNSADDLDNCSFILPAVLRRDAMVITVSSTGRSPAVSSWLKRRIDAVIGADIEPLLDMVAVVRSQIRDHYGSTEAVDWATSLDRHGDRLLELASNGAHEAATALLIDDLQPWSSAAQEVRR